MYQYNLLIMFMYCVPGYMYHRMVPFSNTHYRNVEKKDPPVLDYAWIDLAGSTP